MTQKEINEKGKLLTAGRMVEIAGNWYKAVRVPKYSMWKACVLCDVDCLCRSEIQEVCLAMEFPDPDEWYLELVHP